MNIENLIPWTAMLLIIIIQSIAYKKWHSKASKMTNKSYSDDARIDFLECLLSSQKIIADTQLHAVCGNCDEHKDFIKKFSEEYEELKTNMLFKRWEIR